MLEYPTPSLLAVATGILGSAWVSGSIASFTVFGVPTALALPSQQAHVWHHLFLRGMNVMPKIAVPVGLAYAWTAYDTANRGGKWYGFAAGGLLAAGIVPFTLAFMVSTNKLLVNVATGAASMGSEQVAGLIRKWAILNAVRAVLPLAGAIAGSLTLWSNVA